MVNYRNIRVKMKGGKTRIQRALVLASGKLKFVKNKRSAHVTSHKTTKTKHHRSVVSSLRRGKHHRRGGSVWRSAEKLAVTGALLAPAIQHMMSGGSGQEKAKWILRDYTGWNIDTDSFAFGNLVRGWLPVVGTTIALKAAHKVIGLIRRV